MTTPAFVVSAIRSGAGKTTVTLGLISALARRGKKVAAFKIGPDFLDPSHYKNAGAALVGNLDPILQGEDGMRRMFSNSRGCHAIVVEGVMGLLDGPVPGKITASTADVARRLGLPVLLVCYARSCAQSLAAEVVGVRTLLPDTPLVGVLLNFVGSNRHAELLVRGLADLADVSVTGCLYRNGLPAMPARHLGLVPSAEFDAAKAGVIRRYEAALRKACSIQKLCDRAAALRQNGWGRRPPGSLKRAASGVEKNYPVIVAVARDPAFSFYYPETIDFLKTRADGVVEFSPLKDRRAPDADLYYFGGGFPEIFAGRLSANRSMRDDLIRRFRSGARAYAECGGLMYLSAAVVTSEGKSHPMVGILPGRCTMRDRRQALGYWRARVRQPTLFLKKNMMMIGHEYHWSSFEAGRRLHPVFTAQKIGSAERQSGGWHAANVFASYLHLSALGNPEFFNRLLAWAAHCGAV